MTDGDRARIIEIVRLLKRKYPDARVSLDFETPFQLLVATILAAQSTDKKVNEVTSALFKKYPDPEAFAKADPRELEDDIHATGFFRQKARAIIEASQDIVNCYGGEAPRSMEELTKLRGVGRKTANVVLGNAFGIPGLVVDTHVLRVSGRLGLVDKKLAEKKDAQKVERQLMEIVPREDWTIFGHLLVFLGRDICIARNPKHDICPVLHLCPEGLSAISNNLTERREK